MSNRPCGNCNNLPPPGEPYSTDFCRFCWLVANKEDYAGAWDGKVKRRADPDKPRTDKGGCRPAMKVNRLSDHRELVHGVLDPLGDIALGEGVNWSKSACVKDEHVKALQSLLKAKMTPPDVSGDGIVYVGGGKYWPMIALGIKMARKFTDLPIQVWHDSETESVDWSLAEGIPSVRLNKVNNFAPRIIGGWQNKTTAILRSGFRRVLYLDADAYLVGDPSRLFGERFAFWSDFPDHVRSIKWTWYGLEPGNVEPVQGGQLILDVVDFYKELVIAHWLNQHSDYFYAGGEKKQSQNHQYGDQDSWRVALTATGGGYKHLGKATWKSGVFTCGDTVVHRCNSKIWPGVRPRFDHTLPREGEVAGIHRELFDPVNDAEAVFGRIYEGGDWGPPGYSGSGSEDEMVEPYLDAVSALAQVGGWKSCVDLGSGDGRVTARLPLEKVTGIECHLPHVVRLKRQIRGVQWVHGDFLTERETLPSADVAVLKDVLQHLPNAMVAEFLTWVNKSGKFRWVVIVNDFLQNADDCLLGGYRGLDMNREPLVHFSLTRVCRFLHKDFLLMKCG